MWMYLIVAVILLVTELLYFRVARHFGILDMPSVRSSHQSNVLRGGGIIVPLAMFLWATLLELMDANVVVISHWPFFTGLLLIAITGFIDDVRSLPATLRLILMFIAVGLMLGQVMMENGGIEVDHWFNWVILSLLGLIVFVGAVNIINFMDGINGITALYSLAVLIPLLIQNNRVDVPFTANSYLWVAALAVLVFGLFNIRPKGKAICFGGDVGSLSIGFVLLFALFRLIRQTGDVTWLVLMVVYCVDGGLTIVHRLMLHENIIEAHRKHAYQLMANELKMSHVTVSLIYMGLQLAVSLGFIYLCPNTVLAHWIYFIAAAFIFVIAYVLFKMKYYHLHEEYLASLKS